MKIKRINVGDCYHKIVEGGAYLTEATEPGVLITESNSVVFISDAKLREFGYVSAEEHEALQERYVALYDKHHPERYIPE